MMYSQSNVPVLPLILANMAPAMAWLTTASVAIGVMWLLLRMNRQLLSWLVVGWLAFCVTLLSGRIPALNDASPLLRHTVVWMRQMLDVF